MNRTLREHEGSYAPIVPQLNSGDVLDHVEYMRRYGAASNKLSAERINGKVYLMNALRAATHGDPHALLNHWLFTYAIHDPNLVVSDNPTLLLNADNDPQPDLCLRLPQDGSSHLNKAGYLVGPPELIVEIAGSTASYDFGEKREVYEAAGVSEYLIYEVIEGRIEWWCLDHGRYRDVSTTDGVRRSERFVGLWLNEEALRLADATALIETLRQGMATM